MLQLCPNGIRRPAEHPGLPTTPTAVAADVAACAGLGIADVHVHPKDADGADTVAPERVAAFVEAARATAPGLTVGVTTGEWAAPGPAEMVAAIRAWSVRPDHASVNWHETGADDVAAALLDQGVAVHAGLFTDADGIDRFLASPVANQVARILVEVGEDDPDAGLRSAETLLARLTHVDVPILLHGMDATCWPVLSRAVQLGLDTRIGLEDALVGPEGTSAADNAELVRLALALH
jgi:uncharacterized protein (DUF849 family)